MPPVLKALSAHCFDQGRRSYRAFGYSALRGRALDESAAEDARLPGGCIVEHAGLTWRYALFARDKFDLIPAIAGAQPSRLRRAGRAHPHENLESVADRAIDRPVANPVDVAQQDAVHPQRLARADHNLAARRVQPHHIQRRAGGDTQASSLADREMHDALMSADGASIKIDDLARLERIRPQSADDVCIAAGRHEANILAVLLIRDRQIEAPCQFSRLRFGQVAQRKAQIVELFARGREQEVALVAIGVGGADQRTPSVGRAARRDIMPGRERGGTEFARGCQKIAKLDRAVALNAWYRCLPQRVPVSEVVDPRLTTAVLVVKAVMGDSDPLGDVASIVDVLSGAAGALAVCGRAVIVKLQRDANDIVALGLQQRSRHRGVDAAGHRDDHSCVLRTALEIETVEHRSGHWCNPGGIKRVPPRRPQVGFSMPVFAWRTPSGSAERAWTIGRAEKLLFNIGRIPVRQSRLYPFCVPETANLAAGQKRGSAAAAN